MDIVLVVSNIGPITHHLKTPQIAKIKNKYINEMDIQGSNLRIQQTISIEDVVFIPKDNALKFLAILGYELPILGQELL